MLTLCSRTIATNFSLRSYDKKDDPKYNKRNSYRYGYISYTYSSHQEYKSNQKYSFLTSCPSAGCPSDSTRLAKRPLASNYIFLRMKSIFEDIFFIPIFELFRYLILPYCIFTRLGKNGESGQKRSF